MWCSSCRADVAAELSTDNRRMLCARCQSELGIAATATPRIANPPRTVETERDARELLARWSAQNLLDVASPSGGISIPKPVSTRESAVAKPELRFDQPRTSVPAPSTPFLAETKGNSDASPMIPLDSPHDHAVHEKNPPRRKKLRHPRLAESPVQKRPSPIDLQGDKPSRGEDQPQYHDQVVRDALQTQLSRRTNWSMLAGQLCAYGGVGLLTCGTVLVMWSYFGGPANYMPTGWLTAAVGQMFLFLGVVTLISCGLEQTVNEVTWRIDHLAEEIYHLGLTLDELDGDNQQSRRQQSAATNRHAEDGSAREAA